jgi:heme oxygenase (biliverdin-IX-beta and delta-forming)
MTKGHIQALPGAIRAQAGHQPASAPRVKANGTVRRMLRTATRNDHALIDGMLLPLDLAKSQDYGQFLAIHAESLQAVAGIWRDEDSKDFQAMLGFLRSDLAALGLPTGARCIHACIPANRGAGLGVAYVIRGSRLGAAFLRKSVPASMPSSYLDFAPTLSWSDFLDQLELLADDPAATQAALLAARSTFAVFLGASSRGQELSGASP